VKDQGPNQLNLLMTTKREKKGEEKLASTRRIVHRLKHRGERVLGTFRESAQLHPMKKGKTLRKEGREKTILKDRDGNGEAATNAEKKSDERTQYARIRESTSPENTTAILQDTPSRSASFSLI